MMTLCIRVFAGKWPSNKKPRVTYRIKLGLDYYFAQLDKFGDEIKFKIKFEDNSLFI